MADDPIRIVTPAIMEIKASVLYEAEPYVSWTVGYAPELDDDGGRFVLASLHAAGPEGRVDVEIGATQFGGVFPEDPESDEAVRFTEALATAEALQTLYEVARIAARGVLGTVDLELDIPLTSPGPEISQLVRSPHKESTP